MPRKKLSPEQILGELREVKKALAQGETAARPVRQIVVAGQTHYRCRNEHGGLSIDQARKLKRAVADLTLDKLILKEAAGGVRSAPGCCEVWNCGQ